MEGDEPDVPSEEFTPRDYQVELFEKAVLSNTIVCLGTGTGKTFIAVMLIKHFQKDVHKPFEEGGKRTIFLVPTVPLVVQQQKAISLQTSLRVGGYVGEMGVDNWDAGHWQKEFINSQVLVMTPEIFRIILHHGFLAMSKVNLLILDECHRTVKQHTYREIMRCMDVVDEKQRPRVLGLTASVINSKATEIQVENKIHNLETAMRSHVVTISDQASVSRYGTKPVELIVEHNSSTIAADKVLPSFAMDQSPATSQGEELKRRIRCLEKVTYEMGLWCGLRTAEIFHEEAKKLVARTLSGDVTDEMRQGVSWMAKAHQRLKDCTSEQTYVEHHLLALASPKLKRLLEILLHYRVHKPDKGQSLLCGIVFVEERIVAKVLCEWLLHVVEAMPSKYGFVRPCFVVGHAGSVFQSPKVFGMTFKQQCVVLERFRKQNCNLLVATSVVEEGMDVPKCNLVVRFDFPSCYRSYVQSKGRARARKSLYILLVSREECGEKNSMLSNYRNVEKILAKKCHKREAPLDSEVVLSFAIDELLPPYMPEKKDGAPRIAVGAAINLVNRYCLMLPSDIFTSLKPTYTMRTELRGGVNHFICTVFLPMASPLKEPIVGTAMDTKKHAKMAAALETCKRLHEIGELNDRLLPEKRTLDILEDSEEEEEELPPGAPKPGTKRKRRLYQRRVCKLFQSARLSEAGTYRLHVLNTKLVRLASDIQNWRQERLTDPEDSPLWFGILLREDMPNIPLFPLFTRSGEELLSVFRAGPVELTQVQCEQLQHFHRFIFDNVLRMKERRLLFFDAALSPNRATIAPVMQGDMGAMIDWSLVDAVLQHGLQTTSSGDFKFLEYSYEDAVVIPRYQFPEYHRNTYYLKKVRHDLNPDHCWGEGKASFREYLSLVHKLDVTDRNQPLLELSFTEGRLNLLVPRHQNRKGDTFTKKKAPARTELRVPEFCDVHPLPASVWRKAVCLPSVLYRLNQLLLAEELRLSIAVATDVGLVTAPDPWPKVCFQGAALGSVGPASTEGTEFGQLLRGHGDADVIRMPRLSKSFEYQPELVNNPGPSPGLLLEALTSTKAGDGFDLERLEVLGDSFLKFVVTIDLFCGHTSAHEGLLTQARSKVICNRNLHKLGSILGVGEMLTWEMFEPHSNWLPLCYSVAREAEDMLLDVDFVYSLFESGHKKLGLMTEGELATAYQEYRMKCSSPDYVPPSRDKGGMVPICTTSQLPDKSVADSVEAIIGAYLLTCGPMGALKVMKWMGIRLPQCNLEDISATSDSKVRRFLGFPAPGTAILAHVSDPEKELAEELERQGGIAEGVEKALGYTFKDKSFLLQAITHSSDYRNRLTDCYQRLEFLGDAVIDYVVTRYLYEGPYKFNPGQLTDLRSSLVNNTFFASLVVKNKLHKFLRHLNPGLFSAIGRFVASQEQDNSCQEEEDTADSWKQELINLNTPQKEPDDPDFARKALEGHYCEEAECNDSEEVEVPKALGDLFESLMGAVFLDCGMSLDSVWRIIYRMFGQEIETFTRCVPVPPVRALLERFPEAKFSAAEILNSGKVKVGLTVTGNTLSCVAKSKKLAKTALAKKCLRMVKQQKRLDHEQC